MKDTGLLRLLPMRYVVAAAISLLLCACGDGSPASASAAATNTSTSTGTGTSSGAAPVALNACGGASALGATMHCPPGFTAPASASTANSAENSTASASNKAAQ